MVLVGTQTDLDQFGGEAPGDADPVDGGDEAVSGHRAEDERAQLRPLLAEVVRVDLSEEHGQDHGQHRHQVHLPPVLQGQGGGRGQRAEVKALHLFKGAFSLLLTNNHESK